MTCSLCLFVFDPIDQRPAETVLAGYAVCARHAGVVTSTLGYRDWAALLVIAGLSVHDVPGARPRTAT